MTKKIKCIFSEHFDRTGKGGCHLAAGRTGVFSGHVADCEGTESERDRCPFWNQKKA